MPKTILSFIITSLFLFASFNTTPIVKANNTISFGPVELSGVSPGLNNQTVLQLIVNTTNPKKEYIFNSTGVCYRLDGFSSPVSGPCIREQLLEAATDGSNTHIEITSTTSIFNGVLNDAVTLFLQEPTQVVWDLRPGSNGKTGRIIYHQEPRIGLPMLEINPTKITLDEKTTVKITLPRPFDQTYLVAIKSYDGKRSIASVSVNCNTTKETCTARGNKVDNLSSSGSGNEITFELNGSLVGVRTAVITITSPSLPKELSDQTKKTLEVVGPEQSTLKLVLNPHTFINENETKGANVHVTLENGSTNGRYEISTSYTAGHRFMQCLGTNCTYDLKLEDGLKAGSYTITIADPANKSIQGTAHLTVNTDQSSPPGTAPPGTPGSCIIEVKAPHLPDLAKGDFVAAVISNLPPDKRFTVDLVFEGRSKPGEQFSNGDGIISVMLTQHADNIGTYTINVIDYNSKETMCTKDFKVTKDGSQPGEGISKKLKECIDKRECALGGGDTCDEKGTRGPGIKTAIGCIHTNPVEFTKDLMKFVIGISGGLAFLMMLMGAFQILSSGDNPDTLKAGRERLTSAVIGLLIVIFAILLLQIIGVGILAIPGFGP